MNVKELKEMLSYAKDTDDVTLYDYATGTRVSVTPPDIDMDVRDVFEINFDSTILE